MDVFSRNPRPVHTWQVWTQPNLKKNKYWHVCTGSINAISACAHLFLSMLHLSCRSSHIFSGHPAHFHSFSEWYTQNTTHKSAIQSWQPVGNASWHILANRTRILQGYLYAEFVVPNQGSPMNQILQQRWRRSGTCGPRVETPTVVAWLEIQKTWGRLGTFS